MEEVLYLVPNSILVLISVLILERVCSLSPKYNPLGFFTAITLAISEKVHPKNKRPSVAQQKISGSMAMLTLMLPFLFLAYMMTLVAEFPAIFDGILLWLCLSWSPVKKDVLNLAKALKKDQKSLAKARLSSWVLRRTDNLSPMGLCKAAIEMVILRSSKEYFAVIFYYLCCGSFVMLAYRLAMLLNQCWNPKIVHYRHFGQLTQVLCYLLDWLPARLMTYSMMLLNDFKRSTQLMHTARRWGNDNSLHLLAATAGGLHVSLGGPVFYENRKIRRPVIANKSTKDPDVSAVRQTVALVEKVLAVWLLVILLITAMRIALLI
ncbi:MAG: adenosylcobinamide-phosphate synthase [Alteromonadaceae bacterium]|jgi:adenosylcobinamide-phosphate synthase